MEEKSYETNGLELHIEAFAQCPWMQGVLPELYRMQIFHYDRVQNRTPDLKCVLAGEI